MGESANMWRGGFRAEEIFYVESVMATDTPGRDQEDALPFVVPEDGWPLASLCAYGWTATAGPAGWEPRRAMALMVLSWVDLARLHASIDEVMRQWPADKATAYGAIRDQAVMAYREAHRKLDDGDAGGVGGHEPGS